MRRNSQQVLLLRNTKNEEYCNFELVVPRTLEAPRLTGDNVGGTKEHETWRGRRVTQQALNRVVG